LSRVISDKKDASDKILINEEIQAESVRLVGVDGQVIGIVQLDDALAAAVEEGMDLVMIASKSIPPVCKILDYGKYKYKLQKKKVESKKKQKSSSLKEVQLRPVIGENDLLVKCRSIKKFIEDGDRVKIVLRFKGREAKYQEIGSKILERVIEICGDFCKEESPPKFEESTVVVILVPR
jgi:translation initiation factor IF-3